MFQFNEKLKRLDIPAKSVLRLQRSLGDVQVALPGITAQRATAYVCAFSVEKGLRVAIAFHLRDTNSVVFYLNDDGNLTRKALGAVLQEGVYFTETLGFMLSDLDIHQADPEEQNALWESLPLKHPPKPVDQNKEEPKKSVSEKTETATKPPAQNAEKVEEIVVDNKTKNTNITEEDIDLGLPRAGSLASRRRKKEPPTVEELEEKRNRLRESLGRFLSSM